jgi:hypothetical protein
MLFGALLVQALQTEKLTNTINALHITDFKNMQDVCLLVFLFTGISSQKVVK